MTQIPQNQDFQPYPVSRRKSRLVGIAVLIVFSSIIGGIAGYVAPSNFQFPNLSQSSK